MGNMFSHAKGRMKVFGNRVLRKISAPKGRMWCEAEEECIMRSFVTCTLHQRRIQWMGHAAHMGEDKKCITILVIKPKGKRQLQRPKHI
jgi:hypothetical protein